MSNSDDKTANSSNISSNPQSSNSVEQPNNDPTTNLETIDANKESTLTGKLCQNQINISINQAKSISTNKATPLPSNQNASTSSQSPNNDASVIRQNSNHQNTNNASESPANTSSDIENVTTSGFLANSSSRTDNLSEQDSGRRRIITVARLPPEFFLNTPGSGPDDIRPTPNGPNDPQRRPTLIIIRRHGSKRDAVRSASSSSDVPANQNVDPTNPVRESTALDSSTPTTSADLNVVPTLSTTNCSPPSYATVSTSDSIVSPQPTVNAGVIATISDTQSTLTHDSGVEISITPSPVPPYVIQGPPPISGAPPTYSAIMRLGADTCITTRAIRIQPSPPFIAPVPPPPYTEIQEIHTDRPMLVASADQMIWGPDPISVVCPRCGNVVITSTESQRSNLTHFSALALCLCLCWPCCLLPYCMDSCKNTYHTCPTCQQFLGMYRPW